MKEKIKKVLKYIFGTEDHTFLKFNLSCFITGMLFLILALAFEADNMPSQPTSVFIYISSTLFAIWIITTESIATAQEFFKELFRLFIFFIVFIFSLNFCLNQSITLNGFKLIFFSILSCIGIFFCLFYLISKIFDIIKSIKKFFVYVKQKLFNSVQPATSKVKSLIENMTALLVAIAGLGVAIKTIIEPLINLFNN